MADSDRELLELAAKAAGFGDPEKGRTCWTESEYPRGSGQKGALWNYVGYMDKAELWNPLTDDGDALRLAVKLNIGFIDRTAQDPECAIVLYNIGEVPYRATASHNGDALAATRLAITRAAAEIGRSAP